LKKEKQKQLFRKKIGLKIISKAGVFNADAPK